MGSYKKRFFAAGQVNSQLELMTVYSTYFYLIVCYAHENISIVYAQYKFYIYYYYYLLSSSAYLVLKYSIENK